MIIDHPALFAIAVGALGLITGSLIKVLIRIIPRMIGEYPHDGQHRNDEAPFSSRYPVVEALACLVSLLIAIRLGPTWQTAGMLLLAWFLITLAGIDFTHQLLPDALTLPLLWLGLLFNLLNIHTDLPSAVIGAMAGYLVLWSVFWLFKIGTGNEGMGYGDFKLMAALGAWLGWQSLPGIILAAAVLGIVTGIALIATGKMARHAAIPFGCHIAAAGMIMGIYGADLRGAAWGRWLFFP